MLVMDHAEASWNTAQDQHYFLYPVHVSKSFIMTRGLASAMYVRGRDEQRREEKNLLLHAVCFCVQFVWGVLHAV